MDTRAKASTEHEVHESSKLCMNRDSRRCKQHSGADSILREYYSDECVNKDSRRCRASETDSVL
eukprot:6269746-Amphidinium_carterae.1